jgi:hypothetical protein
MISKRCEGANLFNYIKQKYDCSINYQQIRDSNSPNNQYWLTTITLNNKVYEVIGKSKKDSLNKIMETAKEDIYKVIQVKE